jgi:hypothetical protein
MEIDDNFIVNCQYQIDLLKSLEQTVQEAIKTADEELKLIKKNKGKLIEEVIPPDPLKQ